MSLRSDPAGVADDLRSALIRFKAEMRVARATGQSSRLADAARCAAGVSYKLGDLQNAFALCRCSQDAAQKIGDQPRVAEALNTMGGLHLAAGSLDIARKVFLEALKIGGPNRSIRARVQQNLGILANIQGTLDEALAWYGRSLEEYRAAGDAHGCAIAYNNLGMVSTDRGLFDEADRYFRESRAVTEREGDLHQLGLVLANHAEAHAACHRYSDALACADEALAVFDRIGARAAKSEAYRVIGAVYRDTGRTLLAEARLTTAIDAAVDGGAVLSEAEASRELALLYQSMGRNEETLTFLNRAHRLFQQLDARVDLVYVDGKVEALQSTYLAVVRNWGSSIESSDSYTFGHCERVAENAVAVARALDLDDQALLTIRLGAYLHDLGKVRVPHEILNKPGPLTPDEIAVVRRHPEWGMELLAEVQFPWAIKPIIRSHHEKYDGTGYPDGLAGDMVPLSAQIVGVADVFDALTTTRSYRSAMTVSDAMAEIARSARWWSPAVHAAAMRVLGATTTHAAISPKLTCRSAA